MEEAFDRGYIRVPPRAAAQFEEMPAAYLAARWIGPGRGYVDPVKEAQGASTRMGSLLSTLERECADQGEDWEETIDQAAFEAEELEARGLSRTIASTGSIVDDPSDKAGQAEAGEGAKPEKVAA